MTNLPKITPGQKKLLIRLLVQNNLMDERAAYIDAFTQGRTGSLRALTKYEAMDMIRALDSPDGRSADTQRKKVISYARAAGWTRHNGKADMERINNWCIQYGHGHQPLNDYTPEQLPKLIYQAQQFFKHALTKPAND